MKDINYWSVSAAVFQIITKYSIVVRQNPAVHRMQRRTGHNLIPLNLPMQFFLYLSIEIVLLNYLAILKMSLLVVFLT